MDVLSICPLPVGVVRWDPAGETFTVVMKATFSIDVDGEATLMDVQEPLTADRPARYGEEWELSHPSDFAPLKAQADVLLVGHAFSAEPNRVIAATLESGTIHRTFYAHAGSPSREIPLLSAYLRDSPLATATPVTVGPRRAIVPPQMPRTTAEFEGYNVAPRQQRLAALAPTQALTLTNLVSTASRREVALPGLRPFVVLFDEAIGAHEPREVPMHADTLWIDTDRAVCTLTFRGVAPLPLARVGELATGMRWPDEMWSMADFARQLSRAIRVHAAEAPAASGGGASGAPETGVDEFGDVPTRVHRGAVRQAAVAPPRSTAVLDASKLFSPSLPFVVPGPPSAAPVGAPGAPSDTPPPGDAHRHRPRPLTETVTFEPGMAPPLPPLPFQPSAPSTSEKPPKPPKPPKPSEPAPRPRDPREDTSTMTRSVDDFLGRSAMPFRGVESAPLAPLPPLPPLRAPDLSEPPTPPRIAAWTEPPAAVAQPQQAPVWRPAAPPPPPEPPPPPVEVAPPPTAPALSLQEYVDLRAEVDAGGNLAALLKTRKLTAARWLDVQRQWHARALADAELALDLRRRLADARAAAARRKT